MGGEHDVVAGRGGSLGMTLARDRSWTFSTARSVPAGRGLAGAVLGAGVVYPHAGVHRRVGEEAASGVMAIPADDPSARRTAHHRVLRQTWSPAPSLPLRMIRLPS